jgi:hypothetical protein
MNRTRANRRGESHEMTFKSRLTLPFTGAAWAAAMVLVAAMPVAEATPQSDAPARTVTSDQRVLARPAPKPAKPKLRADGTPNRPPAAPAKPWTLQDALPNNSAATRSYEPPAAPAIGRVPLQSGAGTFGVQTETQVKAHQTPDGRTIPGLEANANRPQSYLGLSLSVPSTDKTMSIPAPWDRP